MPQTITKGYKALVAEANSAVRTLSVEETQALLGREDTVLVDLRDPRELEREGKMPGAFHCPRGMLEFWIDPESPYHKPIFAEDKQFVFFCGGGWRSALAAKAAQEMGLKPWPIWRVALPRGKRPARRSSPNRLIHIDPSRTL